MQDFILRLTGELIDFHILVAYLTYKNVNKMQLIAGQQTWEEHGAVR